MSLGIGRIAVLLSGVAWTALRLFASGAPGLWLDTQDLSTMFQDITGSAPAVVGAPVALRLDKSKGLALGPNIAPNNGTFPNLTGWTVGSDPVQVIPTVNAGQLTLTRGSGGSAGLFLPTTNNAAYKVTVNIASGSLVVGRTVNSGATLAGAGVKTFYLPVAGTSISLWPLNPNSSVVINSITIQEIAGAHAFQSTPASRPMLGRHPADFQRNLFSYTEDTANAYWLQSGLLSKNAGRLIPTTSNGLKAFYSAAQAITGVGGYATMSIEAKPAGYNYIGFGLSDGATTAGREVVLLFNLANGTLAGTYNAQPTSYSIVPTTNGYYRITLTWTPSVGGQLSAAYFVRDSVANPRTTWAADGVSGIDVRNMQLEVGSAATAYQPIIGAAWSPVRNMLTYTEDFSNAIWAKAGALTANATTLSSGVNGTTLPDASYQSWALYNFNAATWIQSLTPWPTTNGRVVYTFTAPGGCSTVRLYPSRKDSSNYVYQEYSVTPGQTYTVSFFTDGLKVGGSQCVLGTSATAYQKVVSSYDVTEAGKRDCYYIAYNGVDQWFQTNAIDLTSTDKVSAFAGIRKLSDAAIGMLLEFSTSQVSNNGSFFIAAPTNVGVSNFGVLSRGASPSNATAATGFPAPSSAVVTLLGNIPADSTKLRINGLQLGETTTDQGTGNFGSYVLYIGRRAGSSLPFNGWDYGITIVGKLANDNEIPSAERSLQYAMGMI